MVLVGALPEDSAWIRFMRDKKKRSMAEWDESEVNQAASATSKPSKRGGA
ncbi:hypothetical protein [Geomicrobium sp. JCM 19037]|nr:hypothetical protein [Geomicrobium sp. JCM 19037]